jgi:hypothetical protein
VQAFFDWDVFGYELFCHPFEIDFIDLLFRGVKLARRAQDQKKPVNVEPTSHHFFSKFEFLTFIGEMQTVGARKVSELYAYY